MIRTLDDRRVNSRRSQTVMSSLPSLVKGSGKKSHFPDTMKDTFEL